MPPSKHLRIPEYQQTSEELRDQIDALYQSAEDAGTLANTGKYVSRLDPNIRLAGSHWRTRALSGLRISDPGEQLHGCFPDAGLSRSGHSLPKEQPQRCSDRLGLAVRLC
jgi:hypothetical protein